MSKYSFIVTGIAEQLGSQMNSFSMLYYLSKITGHSIKIFSHDYKNTPYGQFLFYNGFDSQVEIIESNVIKGSDTQIVPLNSLSVNDKVPVSNILKNIKSDKNVIFVGLFHATFFYHLDYLEDLKKNFFKFKLSYIEQGNNWLNHNIKTDKKIVSVHFRRTDYLYLAAAVCSDRYYINALKLFDSKNHLLVIFSDDIEYCKQNRERLFGDFEVIFSENQSQYVDMYLMSQCDANIIANSSFSIWGSLLNKPQNLMVYPEPMLPHYMNISDLLKPYKNHIYIENPYDVIK